MGKLLRGAKEGTSSADSVDKAANVSIFCENEAGSFLFSIFLGFCFQRKLIQRHFFKEMTKLLP